MGIQDIREVVDGSMIILGQSWVLGMSSRKV